MKFITFNQHFLEVALYSNRMIIDFHIYHILDVDLTTCVVSKCDFAIINDALTTDKTDTCSLTSPSSTFFVTSQTLPAANKAHDTLNYCCNQNTRKSDWERQQLRQEKGNKKNK